MRDHYLACTANDCDRVSLDGIKCTSLEALQVEKYAKLALEERLSRIRVQGCPEAKAAFSRLVGVLCGKQNAMVHANYFETKEQRVAFLRQTDSVFDFPEESLGCNYYPEDAVGRIAVNHLRLVHAQSNSCQLNNPDSFIIPEEKVFRVTNDNQTKKVFRWSGKLSESTVGIGCLLRKEHLVEMKAMLFYEWCLWEQSTWLKERLDPMSDCDPNSEWRMKDLFIVPKESQEPIIIKAMGASALVVEDYCWFLNDPLASAERHMSHMHAVVHANKWLMPNGILAGYSPKKKEQSCITLLRNYLGGKTNSAKVLKSLPKTRQIEF